MKKALTQTIIVFVAVNLITAGFAQAQNVTEEESQPASKEAVVAEKEIELERKKAEIEAKVAEKEVEAAQKQVQAQLKQLLAEQKQFELQIPNIEVTAPSIPLLGQGGSGAVLVIPAAQMKVENLAAITEDMTVMSRIFDTKLSQARLTTGRGSWYGDYMYEDYNPFFGRDSGAIEAIYLEGYGALFLMKVNILLSPPPEAQEEKKTEEEDTDPLWKQMRQEMYAPQDTRRRRGDRPEEKYDAEKVADLKETLIKTLKHAANIRTLKPDESVILTVTGKASQSGPLAMRMYSGGHNTYIATKPGGAGSGPFSPTVLTIRAKKADIDAFANGTLSFDQFSQKTQLLSYSYLGENVGGPSRSSPPNMMYGGSSRNRPR